MCRKIILKKINCWKQGQKINIKFNKYLHIKKKENEKRETEQFATENALQNRL